MLTVDSRIFKKIYTNQLIYPNHNNYFISIIAEKIYKYSQLL